MQINGVTVWIGVGGGSILTASVFGVYWARAFRRYDAVCEMECSITGALVVSVTQHMCSAGVSRMQHRQRGGFFRTLRIIDGELGYVRRHKRFARRYW